jgi:hypothetical protein
MFCPNTATVYANLTTDSTETFYCVGGPTITIEGPITYLASSPIESMVIQDAVTGTTGYCQYLATQYRCIAPYDGSTWTGKLGVGNFRHVCNSTENVFGFTDLTVEQSPYYLNLVVAQNAQSCPVETIIIEPDPVTM